MTDTSKQNYFPIPCRNISFPHLDTEKTCYSLEVRVEAFTRREGSCFSEGSRARWEACVSSWLPQSDYILMFCKPNVKNQSLELGIIQK